MTQLPEADPATRAWFIDWLERFSANVRDVDYASARPLFHPNIIAFGTHQDILLDRESWIATQWDNVWPKTDDFRFNTATTRILISADGGFATVIAPWSSTGFAPDGKPFDRPGRATFVFHKSGSEWLCVHSHLSLNRGVPQTSHANRPVKAR
jgi:ketosteroid isomerase-like protein